MAFPKAPVMATAPRRTLRLAALALVVFATACRRPPDVTLRVAIASDLSPAFEALREGFTTESNVGLAYRFAPSDALLQEMQQGTSTPFDVLVTADAAHVGRLVSVGRCEELSRAFAGMASLVIVTSPRAPRIDAVASLADARYAHVAVMNPERSPFGRAAMQVITGLDVYEPLRNRLVYVDTARRALEQVRSGEVDAAIVPRVIVTEGDSLAVPADLYRPVEQVGVACTREAKRREAAGRFLRYLQEGAGRARLEAYGFVFP